VLLGADDVVGDLDTAAVVVFGEGGRGRGRVVKVDRDALVPDEQERVRVAGARLRRDLGVERSTLDGRGDLEALAAAGAVVAGEPSGDRADHGRRVADVDGQFAVALAGVGRG